MNVFTTIEMRNGSKCSLLEITPAHYWRANFKRAMSQPVEFDVEPFLLEEICRINGKKQTVEELGAMDFQDYLRIKQAMEVMITPL